MECIFLIEEFISIVNSLDTVDEIDREVTYGGYTEDSDVVIYIDFFEEVLVTKDKYFQLNSKRSKFINKTSANLHITGCQFDELDFMELYNVTYIENMSGKDILIKELYCFISDRFLLNNDHYESLHFRVDQLNMKPVKVRFHDIKLPSRCDLVILGDTYKIIDYDNQKV